MTSKQRVLDHEPGTVVFSWKVKPGQAEQLERQMHEMHKVARTFPGHMGVTTLLTDVKRGEYQTILRFDSTEHLDEWLESPRRRALLQEMTAIAHVETSQRMTGLETWFELPRPTPSGPPRWKMVVTTFLAIYPISLAYGYLVAPHVAAWPVAVRALFLPVFAPILLTYLFMPVLTQRVLKGWLYPRRT